MKINLKEVKKIAYLAKLNFSDSEIKNMSSDFEKMLSFINQLNDVNTDGISPLIHVHDHVNLLREDKVVQEDIKQSILSRSSSHNGDYFKVPKVINNK